MYVCMYICIAHLLALSLLRRNMAQVCEHLLVSFSLLGMGGAAKGKTSSSSATSVGLLLKSFDLIDESLPYVQLCPQYHARTNTNTQTQKHTLTPVTVIDEEGRQKRNKEKKRRDTLRCCRNTSCSALLLHVMPCSMLLLHVTACDLGAPR